jgi:2-polyprenyl-3-methyl-5-hydroxy-6-metoxy-1,4-benzoquinol methylase
VSDRQSNFEIRTAGWGEFNMTAEISDVGAGTGNYSCALARRGYTIKAIEPSIVMRSQAEQREAVEWLPSLHSLAVASQPSR